MTKRSEPKLQLYENFSSPMTPWMRKLLKKNKINSDEDLRKEREFVKKMDEILGLKEQKPENL